MSRLGNERGLTLTEVTVVMVIATMVMAGLVGFYLSSQAAWLDSSAQAIAQREASLVLSSISDRARGAKQAFVLNIPADSLRGKLQLMFAGMPPESTNYYYWWNAADSSIHEGYDPVNADRGPMVQSKVMAFSVSADTSFLSIRQLRLRTLNGHSVRMTTTVAMQNHGAP